MILSCPNCTASYAVDPAALGQDGRNVRCSHCGHVWRQAALNDVMPLSSPAYPPSQPYYPPTGYYPQPYPPPPGMYPPPYPPPPGYYPPPPYPGQPNAGQAPYGPGPDHRAESETADQTDDGLEQANSSAADAEQPVEALVTGISEEELDDLFEEPAPIIPLREEAVEADDPDLDPEDLEDPEPISSLEKAPEAGEDVQKPEDLEDPEPIPTILSAPLDQSVGRKKKKGGGGKVFVFLLVLLLLLGGGAVTLSTMGLLPSFDDAIKLVGIADDELGAGLEIRGIQTEATVEDGINLFKVRGTVANVSDTVRQVPNIKVVLSDTNQNEIQSKIVALKTNILDPRTITRFHIQFRDPSENASKMRVYFSADPVDGNTDASER